MTRSSPYQLPALLVATAAASALAAAPALATEGPAAPPPGPTLSSGVAAPVFAPVPASLAPAIGEQAPRLALHARLVHRRVHQGRRAQLRVSLTTPARLKVVITRRATGRRVRVISVPARGTSVALRLPARKAGRDLRPGRYRVRVVAFDAAGLRARPEKLSMIVHR
jgi:hypothetical protein